MRRAVRYAAGAGALAAALWRMCSLLPAPPLMHPSVWTAWAAARGPAVTLMGGLRLATVAADSWLLFVCLLWIAAGASGSASLDSAARLLTPRWLAAAITVTASTVAASSSAWAVTGDTLVMRPAAAMGSAVPAGQALSQPPVALPPGSRSSADPVATAPEPTVRVVQSGDSFWSIAEHTIRQRDPGAPPSAVADYWLSLLAANRALMPDPGNPNVLFPGDRLVLPPSTPAG